MKNLRIKHLSDNDIFEYGENPRKTLSKWSSESNEVAVYDGIYFMLSSDLYDLLEGEQLSAKSRLKELKNHPSVSEWPMYLDGEALIEARKKCFSYIEKINNFLDSGNTFTIWKQASAQNNRYIDSNSIKNFMLILYSEIFNLPRDLVLELYPAMSRLHHSVLTRNYDSVDAEWKNMNVVLNHKDMSLVTFLIADTVPSVNHAVSLFLKNPDLKLTAKNITTILSEFPPFNFMGRILLNELITPSGYKIKKGTSVIFPTSGIEAEKKPTIAFGYGKHKCMGIATTIKFVNSILSHGNRKNRYNFEIEKTPSINMIISAK